MDNEEEYERRHAQAEKEFKKKTARMASKIRGPRGIGSKNTKKKYGYTLRNLSTAPYWQPAAEQVSGNPSNPLGATAFLRSIPIYRNGSGVKRVIYGYQKTW